MCGVDNQGACGWSNGFRCTVEEGGGRASCSTTTGSRSHRIVVIADEYEVVIDQQPPTEVQVLLFAGGHFQLRVPTNAKAAHFDYQTRDARAGLRRATRCRPTGGSCYWA